MDPLAIHKNAAVPSSTNLPRVGEAIDLTNTAAAVNDDTFRVNDRVERLLGDTEKTHWGTITADVAGDGFNEWLVIDNDGVTHRDNAADLAPAVRGGARTKR